MTARGRLGLIVCLLLVCLAAPPARGQQPAPQPDEREVAARQMFGAGRYAEALEIYGKLYAETAHPTYMRNIGRCYQNLGEPDRAISSFREYLRQAKNLAPDQRTLIEGYIREMEELKRTRAAAAPQPRPPAPQPRPPVPPPPTKAAAPQPPLAPAPASAAPAAPAVPTLAASGPEEPGPAGPGSRRTAAYVAGAAGLVAFAATGYFGLRAISKRQESDPHCPMGMCDAEGWGLYQEARTAARRADLTTGVGLLAAGVATYLFLTSRQKPPPSSTARRIRVEPIAVPSRMVMLLETSW